MSKSPKLNASPSESSPEKKSQRPAARRSRASSKGTTPPPEVAGAIEKAPVRKRKATARPPLADAPAVFHHERHQRIQAEAYFIAESRGFHGGSADDDWLQAERRIDAMIADGKQTP